LTISFCGTEMVRPTIPIGNRLQLRMSERSLTLAFYSDFAGHYEKIFPYREGVFAFLDQWLPPGGTILDVGCGNGRYCLALDKSGRKTVGIDLDPGMIGEAEALHPAGDYRILGMEQIGLLPAAGFSGIICIGNVLPHLTTGLLNSFLMDIKKLLIPGGVWIFQTVNFDPILRQKEYRFPDRLFPADNLKFLRRYEDIQPGRLTFHTTLLAGTENVFRGEVTLYPRTSVEYVLGHGKAGFTQLAHCADFSGREFDPTANSGSVFVFRRDEDS